MAASISRGHPPDQPVSHEHHIAAIVLIVSYNGRRFLDDCLGSVLRSEDPGIRRRVVVVDNASTDGTVEYLTERFPEVDCVASAENLGFAGGNNLGWDHIQRRYPDASYVALLNQDTVVRSGWLAELVAHLDEHPQVACAQAKLMLHPDTQRINTVGNVSHFLGFGFTSGYGELDSGQYDAVRTIDFPSGAAFVARAAVLRQLGLFEPLLFLYLEDADLGWKMRLAGWEIAYVPTSAVYHKYEFKGDYRNYYYLERNRLWLLLVYYRVATLVLIAPAILFMEAGQFIFAATKGRLRDKLRSYAFFLNGRNLGRLRSVRRATQARRRISDRQFLESFTGTVQFSELRSPLLRWIANPVLGAYWAVARQAIFW